MKPKLIITIGVSGSGKSTWATNLVNTEPNWVRINRDDIRKTLLGKLAADYYQSPKMNSLEKHINVIQEQQIRYFLQSGENVIVDNTHLRESDYKNYHSLFFRIADIECKVFDVPKDECKANVIRREGDNTNTDYIDKQYKSFVELIDRLPEIRKQVQLHRINDISLYNAFRGDKKPKRCIIVDIDGTVADYQGVRGAYDKNVGNDKVITPVKNLIKRYKGSLLNQIINPVTIIFLSGRESITKNDTINWIRKNKIPFDGRIFMRKDGDTRKDTVVKKELFKNHISGKYIVDFVLDDRISVCNMWHNIGLFVINVNQGLKWF